jgi:HEPN domain-containing protein
MVASDNRVRNWLDEAQADLDASLVLIQGGHFNASVFHCQQAAEKAMKALLLNLHEAPWGHSVWNLYLDACRSLGTEDPTVEKATRSLDFHYISSRYPDAFPSGTAAEHYDRSDAEEALVWAKTVLAFVTKHL